MVELLQIAHIYGVFLGVALVLTLPIVVISRRRVTWRRWEVAAYVLPFWSWFWLTASGGRPKSLANLGEIGDLLVALPIVALVRVAIGRRRHEGVVAVLGQLSLVAVGVITYFATPMLPE